MERASPNVVEMQSANARFVGCDGEPSVVQSSELRASVTAREEMQAHSFSRLALIFSWLAPKGKGSVGQCKELPVLLCQNEVQQCSGQICVIPDPAAPSPACVSASRLLDVVAHGARFGMCLSCFPRMLLRALLVNTARLVSWKTGRNGAPSLHRLYAVCSPAVVSCERGGSFLAAVTASCSCSIFRHYCCVSFAEPLRAKADG